MSVRWWSPLPGREYLGTVTGSRAAAARCVCGTSGVLNPPCSQGAIFASFPAGSPSPCKPSGLLLSPRSPSTVSASDEGSSGAWRVPAAAVPDGPGERSSGGGDGGQPGRAGATLLPALSEQRSKVCAGPAPNPAAASGKTSLGFRSALAKPNYKREIQRQES